MDETSKGLMKYPRESKHSSWWSFRYELVQKATNPKYLLKFSGKATCLVCLPTKLMPKKFYNSPCILFL